MENNFDNFTINIDLSGDLDFSSGFLYQILVNNVRNKVHIINFSPVDIETIIHKYNNNFNSDPTFATIDIENRTIIVKGISKSIAKVYSYSNTLTIDDYLLIIGGEQLIGYSETVPVIETKICHSIVKSHLMDTENWNEFILKVDQLYGDMQNSVQGIVMNLK